MKSMFINCGKDTLLYKKNIVGIFDLDSSSHEGDTKSFLKKAEKEGRITVCGNDLPKAFVVTSEKGKKEDKIYLTTLSSASLAGRNNKR